MDDSVCVLVFGFRRACFQGPCIRTYTQEIDCSSRAFRWTDIFHCVTDVPATVPHRLSQDAYYIAVIATLRPLRLLLAAHDASYTLERLRPLFRPDRPQLPHRVLDVAQADAVAPDAMAVRVDEAHALKRVLARAREHRGDAAGGQERCLPDVKRAQAGEWREERGVAREGGVDPELVGGEGHVRESDVLDYCPGGNRANEMVRRRGHNLEAPTSVVNAVAGVFVQTHRGREMVFRVGPSPDERLWAARRS